MELLPCLREEELYDNMDSSTSTAGDSSISGAGLRAVAGSIYWSYVAFRTSPPSKAVRRKAWSGGREGPGAPPILVE